MSGELHWHSPCGAVEPFSEEDAANGYAHGDMNTSDCACGMAYVVTLVEGAKAEQAHALGRDARAVLVAASEAALRARGGT